MENNTNQPKSIFPDPFKPGVFNWRSCFPGDPERIDGNLERIIALVEERKLDLTYSYRNWYNIGTAFAHEYAEEGREKFHRMSQFHPEYSREECDKHFDYCLKRTRGAFDIMDFFGFVQEEGLHKEDWYPPEQVQEWKEEEAQAALRDKDFLEVLREVMEREDTDQAGAPNIPAAVFQALPDFLQRCVKPGTTYHEGGLLLLAGMGVLSSAFPGFTGTYDSNTGANLYVFISAPPASGKGIMNFLKYLVMPIHKAKQAFGKAAREQYEKDLAAFNSCKDGSKEKPAKPAERMHFIPANNSSTGVFQLLNDNDGCGLIFESEADTIVQAFKSEYGNYSDGFRKANHHEGIQYYRRTDRELVGIERPCLSAVFSGTPGQVLSLFPNVENGLFSRFLFYVFDDEPRWKPKFQKEDSFDIREYYEALGEELFRFYKFMEHKEVKMVYSQRQKDEFNEFFSETLEEYKAVLPKEFLASLKRMGLSFFRLTLILTALRAMEDGKYQKVRECRDEDFRTALLMVTVLARHSSSAFNMLPKVEPVSSKPGLRQMFFEALGDRFRRNTYQALAEKLEIPPRTADRYMAKFVKQGLVQRTKPGVFVKLKSLN